MDCETEWSRYRYRMKYLQNSTFVFDTNDTKLMSMLVYHNPSVNCVLHYNSYFDCSVVKTSEVDEGGRDFKGDCISN